MVKGRITGDSVFIGAWTLRVVPPGTGSTSGTGGRMASWMYTMSYSPLVLHWYRGAVCPSILLG